jgi:1-acyl-sn-glycerol-3-phosphate acyltransferase
MKTLLGLVRFVAAVVISLTFAALEILTLPFHRGGFLFHALARGWAHTVLFICGVKVQTVGLENVRLDRSYVYVSNHASMFDIPAIVAGIPGQIRIVYKKELEVIPIFGWGLKWGSYIGIDRGKGTDAVRSLEEAAEKIRNGASVLLYAEGTRTLDGKLQPFKRGAFNLAVKAGVPVVPLTVNGSFNILRKHSIAIHPGNITLVLGRPISINGGRGKEVEMKLMDDVHNAIAGSYVDQEE